MCSRAVFTIFGSLSRHLGIPVYPQLCRRTRATLEQTHLGAKDRRENLRRAFEIVARPPMRHAAIVDDVVTTGGSTVRAIEAAEAAGHHVVAVLCLVDREQGGADRLSRWPFHPLFRKSEIFDAEASS